MTVYEYLDQLRQGNLPKENKLLQNIASELYQVKDFNQEQIGLCKTLLTICNILYNRTDLEVLPIEDGVYDLLLEKYKRYDPKFQVGSEVVPYITTGGLDRTPEMQSPFVQMSNEQYDAMYDGFFKDSFYHIPDIRRIDSMSNPFVSSETVKKREHNTEHNHPDLVGTLDKCKYVLDNDAIEAGVYDEPNVKILERDFFRPHIEKGIIDPDRNLHMVIELKYDGVSVEADCSDRVLSARSRGDTGIGKASDNTDVLKDYIFPRAGRLKDESIGVKFEAIMQYDDLYRFNQLTGNNYANGRTAIIGLFASSLAPRYRDFVTLVPLALDRDQVPVDNRVEEINFLNEYYQTKYCPLRYAIIEGDYKNCLFKIKQFLKEAELAKSYMNFMYDGIVVSYIDEDIRKKLGRQNYVNKYSMAVKFDALTKYTHFLGYSYTVGQNGVITPMINYEPIEFIGTIHTKSTGNSYDRFMKLNLAIGDVIEVKYVNDVMPRVIGKVDCEETRNNTNTPIPFIDHCPACGGALELSPSKKSIRCTNPICPAKQQSRMVNMMQKLNIKQFSDSRISALGISSLTDCFRLADNEVSILQSVLGNAYADLFIQKMEELRTLAVPDYMILGAIGFSSVGPKTWKSILEEYTVEEIYNLYLDGQLGILSCIQGIGDTTVDTIKKEFPLFLTDIQTILTMQNIVNTKGNIDNRVIVRCSGFRDKELMARLREMGYDADDNGSVTKKTDILLIPYDGYTSSKTKKVSPDRIRVVDKFREELGL